MQENLALKEKVKSLMNMLKKDRIKIKDLEAKIYENSVDMEIEKELNNSLDKGTKRRTNLEVKRESVEEDIVIVDIDEEDQPGHGLGEEDTFFLKGEPTLEEQRNPEESVLDDESLSAEHDVTAVEYSKDLDGTVDSKPCNLGELLQSFRQEARPLSSQEMEGEKTFENGVNSEVENEDEFSNLEKKPVGYDLDVERNITIGSESLNSLATVEEANRTALLKRSSDGKYQCNLCNFKQRDKTLVRIHIKGKHEGFKWKCDECEKELTSPSILKRHKENRHTTKPGTSGSKEIKAKKSTAQKGPVDCKVCGKSISHQNLKRHMLKRHENNTVKKIGALAQIEGGIGTETSEDGLMSPSDAQRVLNQIEHLNRGVNNSMSLIEKNEYGRFQCNICSKNHTSKKIINDHILGAHAGYRWNCNKCKEEFRSAFKLKRHEVKVHADVPGNPGEVGRISRQINKVSCKNCSKILRKSSLWMHMKRKHSPL